MNRPTNQSEQQMQITRRVLLQKAGGGIGLAALSTLLSSDVSADPTRPRNALENLPHHAAKAKRVIFLHQSGAPSQIDLFDPKPTVAKLHGTELPATVRMDQRLTTMTSNQDSLPLTSSMFKFARHGSSGTWLSELLPHTSKIVDDVCFVHSMHTEAINHDPAITFMQTGSEQPGRPSTGAWLSYGLGSENENLPAFVVFISGGDPGDHLCTVACGSAGFLPSSHQGVKFRSGKDAVLYLSNPPGIDVKMRERMLDVTQQLNRQQFDRLGDPAIQARIEQAEMAHAMQMSVPAITDLSDETAATFAMYGEDARVPGTFAANCLMARRLAERGIRFVQLYHRGWDHHTNLPARIRKKCQETDQPSAALIKI